MSGLETNHASALGASMAAAQRLPEQQGDATKLPPGNDAPRVSTETTKSKRAPTLAKDVPNEALQARLQRVKRREREKLLADLGITEPSKHKAAMDELAKLRAEKEERERESMTREQALDADLAKEREKSTALEKQLLELHRANIAREQEKRVQDVASKYLTPKGYKYARVDYIEYLSGLTKSERARVSSASIDRWFQDFARENPEFAIAAPSDEQGDRPPAKQRPTPPTKHAQRVRKVAPTPVVDAADASLINGKTARAGRANSMTKQDINDALGTMGLSARV